MEFSVKYLDITNRIFYDTDGEGGSSSGDEEQNSTDSSQFPYPTYPSTIDNRGHNPRKEKGFCQVNPATLKFDFYRFDEVSPIHPIHRRIGPSEPRF